MTVKSQRHWRYKRHDAAHLFFSPPFTTPNMLALLPLLFTTSTASSPTGDTSPATLCSSQVVSDYTSCYDCIVSDGAITQADAQEAVDGYVSDCSTLGFPVGDITISGGGSSGSGTASSEAGTTVGSSGSGTVSSGTGTTVRSGSTATASAAESTSTATSGGSSSSTTDSGSSSSSSSSSSGDSSSSSGDSDGLPSGSGFKTGSSSRLHTTPAALFAVLSVAVFWHL
ncbi:hypothetical protein FB451DRAFT_1249473 [Mycena latifolia]|nr:hypothetical protein FB451DRAFT_1249473 [Mycena latifolia]